MKKTIACFIGLIIILAAAGGGWYLATNNKKSSTDTTHGLQRLFPAQIGDYVLLTNDPREGIIYSVSTLNSCTPPNYEHAGDPEVCSSSAYGKYENKNNKKEVVYVTLSFLSKGDTWQKEEWDKNSVNTTIGTHKNIRINKNYAVYWYPVEGFNFVQTQEAVHMSDRGAAQPTEQTGKNAVTEYFLNEYPNR